MKIFPRGFTLIELVIFITVTSIVASGLLLTFQTSLLKTPSIHNNLIAKQLADQCMEAYIGRRRLLGYQDTSLNCSATPTLPTLCTTLSGYTINATITCTPTLSGDTANSKTVTVTVDGQGSATYSLLLADY